MKKPTITVCLPICVPKGDYCWGSNKGQWVTCEYFSNEGGQERCSIQLYRQKHSPEGYILKPDECKCLKELGS